MSHLQNALSRLTRWSEISGPYHKADVREPREFVIATDEFAEKPVLWRNGDLVLLTNKNE